VRVTRLCDISVASLVGVADPESSDGSVGQPGESQVFEVSVAPLVEGSEVSVDVADCIVVEISGETVGSVVNDTVSDEDDSDVVVDVTFEQPRGSQVLDVSAALSVEVAGSEVVGVSVDGVDSEAVEVFVIEVSVDEAVEASVVETVEVSVVETVEVSVVEAVEVSVDEASSVVSVALLVVVDGEVGDSIELVSAVVVDGTELVVVLVTTQGMGTIVVIVIVFVVVIVVVDVFETLVVLIFGHVGAVFVLFACGEQQGGAQQPREQRYIQRLEDLGFHKNKAFLLRIKKYPCQRRVRTDIRWQC